MISSIDRRLFGSFVEHMGRCVYGGIYDPASEFADEDGLRTDVMELVKELGVTIVRYPGGNFLSGYDWKDGVGPVEDRPARLDLAWHAVETNEFGTDEFMRWCAKTGIEPMMAANLGTGTLNDAIDLLEYCNVEAPTKFAQQRVANGSKEPYDVKVWCLGNEMDGAWQLGHKSAEDYGKTAADVARGMRQVQGGLELIACGSSSRIMKTFATWEQTVLEHAYEFVDHLSMHAYYEYLGNLQEFLGSAANLDVYIEEAVAVADSVRARKRTDKVIHLALDEYNVWYVSAIQNRPMPPTWEEAVALSEEDYTVADAVVLGDLLVTMLRHADRVKIGCLAQLVNTIATIRAEAGKRAWRQTTFYPFSLTAKHAQGEALVTRVVCDTVDTGLHGEIGVIDAVTTYDESAGEVAVFFVNRHATEDVDVTVDLRSFGSLEVVEHVVLGDADPLNTNTSTDTERVTPKRVDGWSLDGSVLRATAAAISWNMVRLRVS